MATETDTSVSATASAVTAPTEPTAASTEPTAASSDAAAPTAPTAVEETGGVAPPANPLRNQELSIADLPAHPLLARTSTAPKMHSFLHAVLAPALQMADETWPKNWTGGSEKASKPASAKVKLYRWEDNRADQSWVIRRSTHANVADAGSFTWDEIDNALRVDHSKHESEYTPDVYAMYEVCKWGPAEGLAEGLVDGFSEIDMRLIEMAHKLPAPMIPRAFAELVIAAKTGANGLIVVQVPVDLRKVPQAFYSNDRNREEGSSLQKKKNVIMGSYVSIERARTTDTGVIEWTMGTVSDAKGALPQWLQRSQIPSAVAKDVGFVTEWIMKERGEKK